jgi:glutamate synthase domain-containing protein 3
MTGGVAVILGRTGRNFAAGMSGGIAYVLDDQGDFPTQVNQEMVDLEDLADEADQRRVRKMIERHVQYTASGRGQHVLDHWDELLPRWVKIMPKDYKRALADMQRDAAAGQLAVA